ncbi:dihydroneopterin triphosphate diphosphatase [uncultured Thiodictyon sp.]|uniref:dihydroneopterin triphosphate diphosphatase n=1 Tax=uncultured Thiodictyon sp. TaxID=1846217 RepID=UPI003414232A
MALEIATQVPGHAQSRGDDMAGLIGGGLEPATAQEAEPMSDTHFKRPQSVLVVICTRGGEFLMLRRTRPGQFWQSVTGSLAPGESPRLAALREVREETGLWAGSALIDLRRSVLFPIVRAWRERYAPNVRFNREYWFALVLETRRIIKLDPGEHQDYRWLPGLRAAALAGSWTNRDAILALSGG